MDKSEDVAVQLHDAIIDLYLNVKIRHTEEVSSHPMLRFAT